MSVEMTEERYRALKKWPESLLTKDLRYEIKAYENRFPSLTPLIGYDEGHTMALAAAKMQRLAQCGTLRDL